MNTSLTSLTARAARAREVGYLPFEQGVEVVLPPSAAT